MVQSCSAQAECQHVRPPQQAGKVTSYGARPARLPAAVREKAQEECSAQEIVQNLEGVEAHSAARAVTGAYMRRKVKRTRRLPGSSSRVDAMPHRRPRVVQRQSSRVFLPNHASCARHAPDSGEVRLPAQQQARAECVCCRSLSPRRRRRSATAGEKPLPAEYSARAPGAATSHACQPRHAVLPNGIRPVAPPEHEVRAPWQESYRQSRPRHRHFAHAVRQHVESWQQPSPPVTRYSPAGMDMVSKAESAGARARARRTLQGRSRGAGYMSRPESCPAARRSRRCLAAYRQQKSAEC